MKWSNQEFTQLGWKTCGNAVEPWARLVKPAGEEIVAAALRLGME
jgi:hypothetical protein